MINKKHEPVIALAPIKYFDISKSHNLQKIKDYIKRAKKANADIICFPESCLHKKEQLAYNDDLIKEIRAECKKNSIWCIITEDIIFNNKPYNTSILIDRSGKIKGNYKKVHPYFEEEVNPGKKFRIFNTDFGNIGIVICWDLAFPELFRKMKQAGAEIVFCPSQWCYEEKAYDNFHKERELVLLRSLVTTRAFENNFFVCLVNPIMNNMDLVSYSAIVSPSKVLKESIDDQRLLTAKINLKDIKRLEKVYPVLC